MQRTTAHAAAPTDVATSAAPIDDRDTPVSLIVPRAPQPSVIARPRDNAQTTPRVRQTPSQRRLAAQQVANAIAQARERMIANERRKKYERIVARTKQLMADEYKWHARNPHEESSW